jgi:anaerobic selenocysteine-containing dehydrogenase
LIKTKPYFIKDGILFNATEEKMKNLSDTVLAERISRRTLLKGIGAVVATAAVSGCSSGENEDNDYISYAPDLKYDKNVRFAFNTAPYDCGGACLHRYRIKNDRVLCMTSAGDIPRVTLNENDPDNPDEWDSEHIDRPMQYRACVKGYAYMQRLYQADRIKYPMMRTGDRPRGDARGFKRVSWQEAMEEIGRRMVPVYQRAATLGYVPAVWDNLVGTLSNASNMDLPTLYMFSNPSQGLIEAGKMDCVGQDMWRNSRNDRFNSGFILSWGADPSRQSNWENGAYWILQKAKEKGIPIITVTPNCGGNAAVYSNTVTTQIPSDPNLSTSGQVVKIPGWLPVRPGTDGALLTAMMYVIYRRKLYDYAFLDNSSPAVRNCVGFWQGDSVVSVAEPGTHNGFTKTGGGGTDVWEDFRGHTFTVPNGYSFEEYLVSLENPITGLQGWSPINLETPPASGNYVPARGGWLNALSTGAGLINPIAKRDNSIAANKGFDTSVSDAADYYGVLEYAARITGVNALVIEALACHFANNGSGKPSLIDIGCGPQRAYNGAEYYWLAMCFSAICGHADKSGGGMGLGVGSVPDQMNITTATSKETGTNRINHSRPIPASPKRIVVNGQNMAELILNGTDGRDAGRFSADALWTTKGDLSPSRIEIKSIMFSGWSPPVTYSNTNKIKKAFDTLNVSIYMGQVMNSAAIMCDFVFPQQSAFEQNTDDVGILFDASNDVRFLAQNVLRHYMFGIQPSSYTVACFNYYVTKALKDAGIPNINAVYPEPVPFDTVASPDKVFENDQVIREKVEGYTSSASYDRATGNPVTGRSYDRLMKEGCVSIPITSAQPLISLKHHRSPGGKNGVRALTTSTGYINFYSPVWGDDRIRGDRLVPGVPADNFTYSAGWRTPVAKYVPMREGYERFFTENNPYKEFTGFRSPYTNRVYKLQYITNKSVQRAHTVGDSVPLIYDNFRRGVFVNTVDAAERGIQDGDMIYVYNDRGCMKVPAIVSDYIVPGVVSVEHGAWYKPSSDPSETFEAVYETYMGAGHERITVPIDLGGAANVLTDDMFVLDPIYVRNTPTVHGGPCEISKNKPA